MDFRADIFNIEELKEDYIWIFDDFQCKNSGHRYQNTHHFELSTAPNSKNFY